MWLANDFQDSAMEIKNAVNLCSIPVFNFEHKKLSHYDTKPETII